MENYVPRLKTRYNDTLRAQLLESREAHRGLRLELGHAGSVAGFEFDRGRPKGKAAAIGHRVARVGGQVHQDSIKLVRIHTHTTEAGSQLEVQSDAFTEQTG